jgi:hypothetical protein
MSKYVPSVEAIIAQRVLTFDNHVHPFRLTAQQKAKEIIDDLLVHGYIIRRTEGAEK